MNKETGGPAFPCDNIVERNDSGQLQGHEISSAGMTLRDYFAAHSIDAAFHKAINNFKADGMGDTSIDWCHIAESAYDAADAMLEARKK